MLWLCRTVEKLDAKDDRVRALKEEQRDVQQKIEAQRREFAERQELLKGDHEIMLNAVNHSVTHSWLLVKPLLVIISGLIIMLC